MTAADRWAETYAIRDAILRIASEPRSAGEIRDRLRVEVAAAADLGERRFWRALSWLVAARRLQQAGRKHGRGARYVAVPEAQQGATA